MCFHHRGFRVQFTIGRLCRFGIIVLVPGWFPVLVSAQITYTAAFTKTLYEAGIEYAAPTEQWLHVVLPPEDDYMDYNLVLENDRNDFEVRYRIQQHTRPDQAIPASIEVARLVASIASNAPETEIRIQIPPDSLLQKAFNADRGIIAYFTPKFDFSEKPYGALISLDMLGGTGIDVILLYYDPAYDPLYTFRSVRFRE